MPTVQTTDDFNHAIDAGYYNTFWGGPPAPSAVTTPIYQSQPKTLKMPATSGQNVGVRTLITGSPTRSWMGIALRLEALPTVTDIRLCQFEDSGGAEGRFAVGVGNGNLYCYISGGSTQAYSGNPLVADTWYWLEAILDSNDGTGTKKLYWRIGPSGGTITDQTTATFVQAASTGVHSQIFSGSGDGTCDYYAGIWKMGSAASTSDWLGEPLATSQKLRPDADVTTTGWSTAPLWSKIEEEVADGTVITATAS